MVLRLMSQALGDRDASAKAYPALRPNCACYVVGDIHGRLDLLHNLLRQIDEHVGAVGVAEPHLVFVGDYIDWGPDGAGVLVRLWTLAQALPRNAHCLMGQHERMLLRFLQNPVTCGRVWLQSGGLTTLASFGIDGADPNASEADLEDIAYALRLEMNIREPDILDWLTKLRNNWSSGNLTVIGAGAHAAPIHGHNWVATGHKICDAVTMGNGRISLDTGAVASGRLSALALVPGQAPVVLQT